MKKIAGLAAAGLAGVMLSGCIVVDADVRESHWDWDDDFGYLRAVLKELNVPLESQVLVFSKTSFQAPRIAPPPCAAVKGHARRDRSGRWLHAHNTL